MSHPSPTTLRLPPWVLAESDRIAAEMSMSRGLPGSTTRSDVLRQAILRGLQARDGDELVTVETEDAAQ